MKNLTKAYRRIDWFKSRGYLLGQNKDKYYIVHPQDGRKDFDTFEEARDYVEHMIAFRQQQWDIENRY